MQGIPSNLIGSKLYNTLRYLFLLSVVFVSDPFKFYLAYLTSYVASRSILALLVKSRIDKLLVFYTSHDPRIGLILCRFYNKPSTLFLEIDKVQSECTRGNAMVLKFNKCKLNDMAAFRVSLDFYLLFFQLISFSNVEINLCLNSDCLLVQVNGKSHTFRVKQDLNYALEFQSSIPSYSKLLLIEQKLDSARLKIALVGNPIKGTVYHWLKQNFKVVEHNSIHLISPINHGSSLLIVLPTELVPPQKPAVTIDCYWLEISNTEMATCVITFLTSIHNTLEAKNSSMLTCKHTSDSLQLEIQLLIVEDNLINQQILSRFFDKVGISHKIANNGQEALDLMRQFRFKVALVDIVMPVMNGIEMSKIVKETPELSHTILVALTASTSVADRDAALSAGCNDYLVKPVSFDYLHRKLREWGVLAAFDESICYKN